MKSIDQKIVRRIRNDVMDSYDEELEMELDDRTAASLAGLASLTNGATPWRTPQEKEDRRLYFVELFRLQGELVKLQDWIKSTGHKVVILFEGRDAAGK